MAVRFVITLVFSILVAIFAIQNSSSVVISFLFAKFSISQALIILISAVLGAVIVMLLGTIKQIKSNLKIRNLSKEFTKLQEENKSLKERIEQLSQDSEKRKEKDNKVLEEHRENSVQEEIKEHNEINIIEDESNKE